MSPSRTEAFRVELPSTSVLVTRLLNGFARHLSVWRKSHFEFGARKRYGGERFAGEKGCPDVIWGHRLRGEGGAGAEED